MRKAYTLENFKGEYISHITFVMDYVQIGFGEATLTIYSRPIAKSATGEYRFPEIGSRDALCSFIGHTLIGITVHPNDHIAMLLDNGMIKILLDSASRFNGDAAEFWPEKGKPMIDY